MQTHAEQRFTDRFAHSFQQEGLMNVKFFVMNKGNVSLADFLEEATAIRDTIQADDFEVIGTIDGETQRRRFDAVF